MKGKKSTSKSSVVDQVLVRLKEKERPERGKRTLVLTKATYSEFERLCRENKNYPSDVIDEFIALFVNEKGEGMR